MPPSYNRERPGGTQRELGPDGSSDRTVPQLVTRQDSEDYLRLRSQNTSAVQELPTAFRCAESLLKEADEVKKQALRLADQASMYIGAGERDYLKAQDGNCRSQTFEANKTVDNKDGSSFTTGADGRITSFVYNRASMFDGLDRGFRMSINHAYRDINYANDSGKVSSFNRTTIGGKLVFDPRQANNNGYDRGGDKFPKERLNIDPLEPSIKYTTDHGFVVSFKIIGDVMYQRQAGSMDALKAAHDQEQSPDSASVWMATDKRTQSKSDVNDFADVTFNETGRLNWNHDRTTMIGETAGGKLEIRRTYDKNGKDNGFQSTFSFQYDDAIVRHFTRLVDGKPVPEPGVIVGDRYGKRLNMHVGAGAIVADQ